MAYAAATIDVKNPSADLLKLGHTLNAVGASISQVNPRVSLIHEVCVGGSFFFLKKSTFPYLEDLESMKA